MANRDILITPHRLDVSYNPRIDFVGASTGSIHLEVLETGAVSFMGNNGALFSIVDDASGSLMSVNNISGLPIFEVWSTDQVDVNGYLKIDGSAQVRAITLIYPPLNPSDATNKFYVDSSFALKTDVNSSLGNYVLKSGDVMSGNLTINASLITTGVVKHKIAGVTYGTGFRLEENSTTDYWEMIPAYTNLYFGKLSGGTRFQFSDNNFYIGTGSAVTISANANTFFAGGNVGIKTTDPKYTLDVSGSVKIDGSLNILNQKITGVLTPTNSSDAVNKWYADNTFTTNASSNASFAQFIRSTSSGSTIKWAAGLFDVSDYISKTSVDASFASFQTSGDARWIDINRMGLMNQTETNLLFNPTNYVFTLSKTGASWKYLRYGIEYTINQDVSVQIGNPPAKEHYFIYIDDNIGTLTSSTIPWTLQDGKLPVAIVLWDASTVDSSTYWIADERHSCLIDRRQHWYLHQTRGTQYVSGGLLDGPTLASQTNQGVTFGISQTVIADEDIILTLPALTRPDGSTAAYTIFYRTDSSTWAWRDSSVPYLYGAGSYISWDNNGVLTTGANSDYYNYYLLFSDLGGRARYGLFPGRGDYASLAAAQAESVTEFSFTNFPIVESVIAYQLTYTTSNSYNNLGKARLAATPVRIRAANISTVGSGASTDHNTLAGLQGGVAGQYYHMTAAQNADIVGKIYVDGSLGLRDVSIDWLNQNKVNNSSLNLYYLKTQIDSSFALKTYVDASFALKTYVDASFALKTYVDSSFALKVDVNSSLGLYVKKAGDTMTGKLIVNASVYFSGQTGLGVADASAKLHVKDTLGATQPTVIIEQQGQPVNYIQFFNSGTGNNGFADGLTLGNNSYHAYIQNRESLGGLYLGTNNLYRIIISKDGSVVIGANEPGSYKFEVFGNAHITGALILDGSIALNNQRIIGLAIPINSSDAVNKFYVDSSFLLRSDTSLHRRLTLNVSNGLYMDVSNQILSLQLATISGAGALKTLSGASTDFLNGAGNWALPSFSPILSTGVAVPAHPEFTDLGSGLVQVTSTNVYMYDNSVYQGAASAYAINGSTFTLTDGAEQYICAKYNGGSPIMYLENDETQIHRSDIVPLHVTWRVGTTSHSYAFDSLGLGLNNKIQDYFWHTDLYKISNDGGLVLSEYSPPYRSIRVSAAEVYTGAITQSVAGYDSSVDLLTFVYHNASTNWSYVTNSSYNNNQIDNGTNLLSMTDGRYGLRWFYRSIGDVKETFYVLDSSDYVSTAEARLVSPRTDLPIVLRRHSLLVGRSIILKNASIGVTESVATDSFSVVTVINHNDTNAKQGGNVATGNFYHSDQGVNMSNSVQFNAVKIATTPTDPSHAITKYMFDLSIGAINASLNDTYSLNSYVNTSSYYDGSLNLKVSKSGDTMTGNLTINASLFVNGIIGINLNGSSASTGYAMDISGNLLSKYITVKSNGGMQTGSISTDANYTTLYSSKSIILEPNVSASGTLILRGYGTGVFINDNNTNNVTIGQSTGGNVGIGISPSYRLDVSGNTRMRGSTFIDVSLGVGTIAPETALHIATTKNTHQLIIQCTNSNPGDVAGILFSTTSAANYFKAGILFDRTDATAQGDFLFALGSNGGAETVNKTNAIVTITKEARLGVGFRNPSYNVDISGNLHSTGVAYIDGSLNMKNNIWMSAKNASNNAEINILKVNTSDEVEMGATFSVGHLEAVADSGAVTLFDMPVTTNSSSGLEMSATIKIDGYNILKIYTTADGSGGVSNFRVKLLNKAKLMMQDASGTEYTYEPDTFGGSLIIS